MESNIENASLLKLLSTVPQSAKHYCFSLGKKSESPLMHIMKYFYQGRFIFLCLDFGLLAESTSEEEAKNECSDMILDHILFYYGVDMNRVYESAFRSPDYDSASDAIAWKQFTETNRAEALRHWISFVKMIVGDIEIMPAPNGRLEIPKDKLEVIRRIFRENFYEQDDVAA